MNITVRKLEEEYADAAYNVEQICLKEAWSREAIFELIDRKNAIYLVAVYDNTVCGIAGMYIVADEGQINNVAVLPEYRKQGIGKIIFDELLLEGKKKDVKLFTLEVAASNSAAIKLYSNCGFDVVGRRKGFYKNDDALIMDFRIDN
ncbi:MAG: ribosomal-protein-alanine N-acetyltransferase [Clostridiales bacterium GWF2_36_10]|nr:MAG: ribosomal-protein-alanine N-acetyltransferase [Clostridiales bacterium GWF2_36_10]